MSVKLEYENDILIAKLDGDIDHHKAADIRGAIDESLQRIRPSVLRLDFMNVPFMDSTGIGLILGRIRLIKRWGGKVVLCNISDDIYKMAKIAGVFSFAKLEEKEESA